MSNSLHMNNFKASWKHFKRNINTYESDDGVVEFRYEDVDNGDNINVVINYIETTNTEALHELLRTIIDDMPIDPASPDFGTIVFKGYYQSYHEFELNLFRYKTYVFRIAGNDCVMYDTTNEDE